MSIRATFIKKNYDMYKDAEEIVQKAVSGQKEQPQKQMQGHWWQDPGAKKRIYVGSKNTTRQLIVSLTHLHKVFRSGYKSCGSCLA